MNPTPPPIRVLYIARAPFVSGAERALVSMLRRLDRARVAPAVVLGAETDLLGLVQRLDIPVTVIPLARRSAFTFASWWRSRRAIARFARAQRTQLLHANDVPSAQAMSVLGDALRLPRVVHVRWTIAAPDAAWWLPRGCETILCISAWIREQLGSAAGTPLAGAEVQILPDAVDWPADDAAPVDLPPDPRTRSAVGFAGQLIPAKGLELLIDALALIAPDRRPRLLIAGKDTQTQGRYEQQLREHARRAGVAGDIDWLGFLPDVSALYRQVDAVVCPSLEEPLGLVPLEAARFALPCIANRIGGLRETIVDHHTGRLVDPTPQAWALALTQLGDPGELRRMGLAARARTIEHYAPLGYQRRLMAVYDRLLHPTPRAGDTA